MPVRSPTVVVEQPATQLNFEELYGILSDGAPGQVLTGSAVGEDPVQLLEVELRGGLLNDDGR